MKALIIAGLTLISISSEGQFPVISQGNIEPGDQRLTAGVDESKTNELTIASFNVRNLGSRSRSFKDYAGIVDYVDEADIVVFQEVGLGIYDEDTENEVDIPEFRAVLELLSIAFGEEWNLCIPDTPSGVGEGREMNVIAYREECNGYTCSVTWEDYVDLGERRDMPIFRVQLTSNGNSQTLRLGSVHLKPDDPIRGIEMNKAVDWLTANNSNAIILGDFNWGYRRTANIQNYLGEQRIISLHDSGVIFHLFHELSYLGQADDDQLRTNMGFRKGGYFYDQILMSRDLAEDLADGGDFLSDCGIFAYDLRGGYMNKTVNYIEEERSKGLNKYVALLEDHDEPINSSLLDETRSTVSYYAHDYATYFVSDHRIVWVQLDLFND